jgi:hypothetical protein
MFKPPICKAKQNLSIITIIANKLSILIPVTKYKLCARKLKYRSYSWEVLLPD